MTDKPRQSAQVVSRDKAVLLQAENVSRVFTDGQVTAVDGVNLTITEGEYVAIMGKSGSGKSTLLNILGSLDHPTAGRITFRGQPIGSYGDEARFRAAHLGFVFQSFHLIPVLSAIQNIQIPMFETSRPVRDRVKKAAALLDLVGMGHRAHHRPSQLSVGERQRIAIARALANDPVLLLADEPTGNLDTQTANQIFELLDKLHESGMTILLITHDPALGARAQRMVHMRDGRMEDT